MQCYAHQFDVILCKLTCCKTSHLLAVAYNMLNYKGKNYPIKINCAQLTCLTHFIVNNLTKNSKYRVSVSCLNVKVTHVRSKTFRNKEIDRVQIIWLSNEIVFLHTAGNLQQVCWIQILTKSRNAAGTSLALKQLEGVGWEENALRRNWNSVV